MKLPLLLALALAFGTSLVPAASAQAVVLDCGFNLNFWDASYACHVNSIGGTGTLAWCPDPVLCGSFDVLACHVDNTPPWTCTLL